MSAPPLPDRLGEISHAGRRIGWSEWGPADGIPVLFCTGAAMTSSFGFGGDPIDELGIRMLIVDRAGLGRSDPDPNKTLESYARDVELVLAAQHITRPPAIGFSQGAPFAIALAGAKLVSSLSIVSGQDELAHPKIRPLLHPEVAHMVEAIESDRARFESELEPHADADGMWKLIVEMSSPHDRAIYEAPDFAAAFRRTLAEAFARGPAGYVRDLTLAMSRWSTQPEEVEEPVSLWYGELDASPVHSPDRGETLRGRFPHATLHRLSDEGGSLLFTRSREILADAIGLDAR